MRRLLPLAVSLALAQAAAASGNEGPPAFEPAIVELRVNDQDDGPTLVVRRVPRGALLLRAADLPQLRIRTPSRGLMLVDGERYFRFAPDTGAEIGFDEATQSARITLPPSAFLPTVARATSPDVPSVTPAGLGGFVNYDITGERVGDRNGLGTFLDLGAFGMRVMSAPWTKMEHMLVRGLLRVDPVITHEMPLERFAESFELLEAGNGGKVILTP